MTRKTRLTRSTTLPGFKAAERQAAALAARDAAVLLVSAGGVLFETGASEWKAADGSLAVLVRSPKHAGFCEAPPVVIVTESRTEGATVFNVDVERPPPPLPWNVDIWARQESGNCAKVLNLGWDERGAVQIVTFKRGKWEQHLQATSAGAKRKD